MNQLKKSLFMEYNLLYKKNLSFAAAGLQKNSKLFNNRPGETLTQTVLYLEPYSDYQINFVNIDSCHECGILGQPFWRYLSCIRSLVVRN